MKKQMMKSPRITTVMALMTLMAVFFSGFTTLHAQEKATTEPKPVVKYLGKINGQPLLQVEFDGTEDKPYLVSVQDAQGYLLYSDKFTGRKYSKRFQLAQDESGPMKISLTFTSGKEKQSQTFEISTISYIQEDVVLTKLK
ncbi:MAG TPA: hypothetical protein VHK91_07385 [Flavisolibacter sp.]|jgi:hypothetical protein|nr:hypothetical protein [Flavisolibacter sp.]